MFFVLVIIVAVALMLLSGQSQPPVRIVNPTNLNPMPGYVRMQQFDLFQLIVFTVQSIESRLDFSLIEPIFLG